MLGAGPFLVALGLPSALFPYHVARFAERTDAIGSKTPWTRVEPADAVARERRKNGER
jgi:hypothetical protein